MICNNLTKLEEEQKITKSNRIVLWGISNSTKEVVEWLNSRGYHVTYIVDNFKYTFYQEYLGIPVRKPDVLQEDHDNVKVLLAVNFSDAIRKQLHAYGITDVYNLRALQEKPQEKCEIPYHFVNRKRDCDTLCYIIAGYEKKDIWSNVLERVKTYQDIEMDICIVSSGKYLEELDRLARTNQWSYLWTDTNQVSYIQNQVIELHPNAQYIFKLDEDIFIGKHYFSEMKSTYQEIETEGEYRINFLVPVISVNCYGYRTFLNALGKTKEYESLYGRAYRSRFSAVFSLEDVAEYLWKLTGRIDETVDAFYHREKQISLCNCYFNIGAILYSRERWLLMGKWPEIPGTSGMGIDETTILKDGNEKDFAVYEVGNVFVGHFAFGHQKKRMMEYFIEHKEDFEVDS